MSRIPILIEDLVKRWSRPTKGMKRFDFLIITFLFILSYFIVYYTGGSKYFYVHIAYIPIIYSALVFRTVGGFIGGILAGVIMGPIMPLEVQSGIMQDPLNWVSRMVFFTFLGSLAGIVFEVLLSQFSKIEQLAYYDVIVGLPNKLSLQKKINEKIDDENNLNFFVVISLTIESYLEILDIIGHDISDIFWSKVGNHIQSYLSDDMFLYTYDSSKFGILLLGYEKKEAIEWANGFSDFLNYPINLNGIPIYLNTNLGLALYPEQGKTGDEIIQKSYIAMDNARKKGLNYSCYHESLVKRSKENLLLLGEVKEALEQEHFILYYQPKMDLRTEHITGVEALIRWNHPEKGFIPPNDFIPEVENTDLINQISYWVLDRAISDFKYWRDKGLEFNVAVNISTNNLQHYKFMDEIDRLLDKYSINSFGIELELTERDIMLDFANTNEILNQLLKRKFTISIDDFGTGYSSLSYLKYLPVDIIKIDRAFVKNILVDKGDKEITNAAIKMGHALEKDIIAEGVETKEGMELLKDMGCDYAQGYYISKPMPKEKIDALLSL